MNTISRATAYASGRQALREHCSIIFAQPSLSETSGTLLVQRDADDAPTIPRTPPRPLAETVDPDGAALCDMSAAAATATPASDDERVAAAATATPASEDEGVAARPSPVVTPTAKSGVSPRPMGSAGGDASSSKSATSVESKRTGLAPEGAAAARRRAARSQAGASRQEGALTLALGSAASRVTGDRLASRTSTASSASSRRSSSRPTTSLSGAWGWRRSSSSSSSKSAASVEAKRTGLTPTGDTGDVSSSSSS